MASFSNLCKIQPPLHSAAKLLGFCVGFFQNRFGGSSCRLGWFVCVFIVPLVCSVVGSTNGVAQQKSNVHGEIAYVNASCDLLELHLGKMRPIGRLKASSTVRAMSEFHTDAQGGTRLRYRKVQHFEEGRQQVAWVANERITPLTHLLSRHSGVGQRRTSSEGRTPALIRVQPVEVRRIWNDIQKVVQQSEGEVPEPFLARAMLWRSVHNHERAVQDYLKAASIVLSSEQPEIASYVSILQELRTALHDLDRLPFRPYPGEANQHYTAGYQEFWSGNLEQALRDFTDAIELHPSEVKYRYYRALTYYRMGDRASAERDARIGVYFESRIAEPKESAAVHQSLERVQGRWRTWLERIRRGEPHFDPLNPDVVRGDPSYRRDS